MKHLYRASSQLHGVVYVRGPIGFPLMIVFWDDRTFYPPSLLLAPWNGPLRRVSCCSIPCVIVLLVWGPWSWSWYRFTLLWSWHHYLLFQITVPLQPGGLTLCVVQHPHHVQGVSPIAYIEKECVNHDIGYSASDCLVLKISSWHSSWRTWAPQLLHAQLILCRPAFRSAVGKVHRVEKLIQPVNVLEYFYWWACMRLLDQLLLNTTPVNHSPSQDWPSQLLDPCEAEQCRLWPRLLPVQWQ